ncbi:MAG: TetR family transcriptional regulator [Gemmatimonadota bacterium]
MASTPTRDDTERTRLSKQTVVERALALADSGGLDALTIRRLAQDLGVTPMALYWHFRSKEELIAGLADRIWGEIATDVDPAQPWPAQLRGLLESLIAVLRAHPAASQLLIAGEKQSPAGRDVTETALAVLRSGGFDAQHASEIARSGLWTGLTLVMSEPGFDPGLTEQERAELQRRRLVELASLPRERYPCLVESAAWLTACDDPEFHYRFGVDLFIAGVEAMATRQAG